MSKKRNKKEENKETEESKELSPWQQKHLEYEAEQREKNKLLEEEALAAAEKMAKEAEAVVQTSDEDSIEASEEQSDQSVEDLEGQEEIVDDLLSPTPKEKRDKIFPVFKKMWGFFLVFFLIFGASIYFASPYSKVGKFQVKGEASESVEALAEASGIRLNDKIIHIYAHRSRIEQAISKSFPRVESTKLTVAFPNKVLVSVKEYPVIAYVKHGDDYYPVLSSGSYLTTDKLTEDKIDKKFPLLVEITDETEVKQFVKAYTGLTEEISSQIARVEKTPTKATSDLLTIDLRDGNRILVPLSEMSLKLPYYPSVKESLTEVSDIDMEAGIFSYAKGNPPAKESSDEKTTEDKTNQDTSNEGNNTENHSETSESQTQSSDH
ncbi:FtsQ-type POTRA domain-containing protein [Streptococcaceae bacterium ESL0687]|nr:FtsQ-type POTRA domain-containing protein [Streptococcaceae bacterium ESL0687]